MDVWSLLALMMGVLGTALAVFFLVYGVRAGIVRKRILASSFGDYDTGRSAVTRGVVYVALGLLFLGGAVLIFATLVARHGP